MTIFTDPSRAAKAVPIVVIHAANYDAFLAHADPRIRTWLSATGFRARPHTHALVAGPEGGLDQVLVGVEDAGDVYALSHLPLALPAGDYAIATHHDALDRHAAALSWGLGSYQFTRYKKAPRDPANLIVESGDAATRAEKVLAATILIRDLINTPTEDMGPQHLADRAQWLAKEFGGRFREWVGDDLLKHNFPAIHAVGRASHRPPRLIELTWGDEADPRVAIVGKGVCFDTGGLDIKGADGMRHMKKDMGGGAHALGVARLIMDLKLPVRLQMLIPAVENAIAGNAYRPGDVVATRKGLNIEIGNTDAEGRVVLSDALALAAVRKQTGLARLATECAGVTVFAYEAVAKSGRLLSPLDHADPAHCYVTGTGLTHLGSADTRDAMHKKIDGDVESLSDSMKMFRWGVEGGKPAAGKTGVQPEWFYKGDGRWLVPPGAALPKPSFACCSGAHT